MIVGTEIIDRLDGWANALAAPLMPPRVVLEGQDYVRLEFRQHIPHTVMVGKVVRAVSGLYAARLLAEVGFVTECASLLRIVSDLCTEITVIAESLRRGGEPPRAVRDSVNQYFEPKPRTVDEFASKERRRHVSREELMKCDLRRAQGTTIDGERLRTVHRFLNMTYDAYVHGAYETTMELCDPRAGVFAMRGHPNADKRQEFVEAVFLKMHEVVIAIELTAALTAQAEVFEAAREARHVMDASEPWIRQNDTSPA